MEEPQITLDAEEIIAEPQGEEAESAVEQTTESESSTEETNAEAETSDEEPSEGEETEGEDSKESDNAEETETDQPKFETAEKRKASLQTEIRTLVAQRNAIREDVALANQKAYQPATAQELMESGMDEATARVEALEQRQQLNEFNTRVADVTAALNTEALQVMHDYPLFDEQSPEFNADVAKVANDHYRAIMGAEVDEKTGLTYHVNATPYQTYQTIAQAYEAGREAGKLGGQRATEKMLAAADTPTSAAPKAPKEDPFFAGLTRGFN